jgi:hypothetical protein
MVINYYSIGGYWFFLLGLLVAINDYSNSIGDY